MSDKEEPSEEEYAERKREADSILAAFEVQTRLCVINKRLLDQEIWAFNRSVAHTLDDMHNVPGAGPTLSEQFLGTYSDGIAPWLMEAGYDDYSD